MRGSEWVRTDEPSVAANRPTPAARRNAIAALAALLTLASLGATIFVSEGTHVLMPGPLASVHGAVEKCSACHTKSGSSKVSWVHGLVSGDPLADSKACLTCHKMPETAFNAHSASPDVLKESTKRLRKVAAGVSAPFAARVQSAAFSTDAVVARDLYCATCHQEHQGTAFKLNEISSEQCRSCHVVKFDSFDGRHPEFESFPFKRRSRIIFDHTGHFDKHFPEVAKKDKAKRFPETCSACHDSRQDKRVMAVTKFDDTCATCHLDQITGKERASGPKGVAFLTLPGLDLETLNQKKVAIGEWPEGSEAALTPFMAMMLSRDERGRALVKTVADLNLQDLSKASDAELKSVGELALEIKKLYFALVTDKASDVLSKLDTGTGVKLSATLIADLTASIPRDVIVSAQQDWLPNLAKEMGGNFEPAGEAATEEAPEEASASAEEPVSEGSEEEPVSSDEEDQTASDPDAAESEEQVVSDDTSEAEAEAEDVTSSFSPPGGGGQKPLLDPPPCSLSILGQCLVSEEQKNSARATVPFEPSDSAAEDEPAPEPEVRLAAGEEQPAASASNSKDELLFPTEEELREIKAHYKAAGQSEPKRSTGSGGSAGGGEGAGAVPSAGESDAAAASEGVESEIDPESWADYGGWYRQDYAIYYSPVGHKDKFIYSWLVLTSLGTEEGAAGPAASVFKYLTSKDAQGACTKCHSVDGTKGERQLVNFTPKKAEAKKGRFTRFIHEPHLSMVDDRGCLTCHSLAKGVQGKDAKAESAYLKGYEQGDPKTFRSGFAAVEKETCQSCHTAGMARQDCLTCHTYHVEGVVTPITSTKLPTQ